jgi:hypothetical protein
LNVNRVRTLQPAAFGIDQAGECHSGMGEAMAEEFTSEGEDIVVAYRSDEGSARDTQLRVEAKGAKPSC